MTTTETITARQIRQLRTEASAANDGLQVAVCDVALADGISDVAEIDEDFRADLEHLGIVPEHVGSDVRAREVCARAINAAAAQAATSRGARSASDSLTSTSSASVTM